MSDRYDERQTALDLARRIKPPPPREHRRKRRRQPPYGVLLILLALATAAYWALRWGWRWL